MDENKDPGLSSASYPSVIKVKKTSTDSWHIEQQEESGIKSIEHKGAGLVMSPKTGKSMQRNSSQDMRTAAPCRVGNSTLLNQINHSSMATTPCIKIRNKDENLGKSNHIPSMTCENQLTRSPPQVCKVDDETCRGNEVSSSEATFSCLQCEFLALTLKDFMNHIKQAHYRCKHKLGKDLSTNFETGENASGVVSKDCSKMEKRSRLGSYVDESVTTIDGECPQIAEKPDKEIKPLPDATEEKSLCQSGTADTTDPSMPNMESTVNDFTGADEKKQKATCLQSELPVGRVSPFIKHEKCTDQDNSLGPPPLEQLGIDELSSFSSHGAGNEQMACVHSNASNSSSASSISSTKDQKASKCTSRGAKLDSIVNSLKESTVNIPKFSGNASCLEGRSLPHELSETMTNTPGFGRPFVSGFPTPIRSGTSSGIVNNCGMVGSNFFNPHPGGPDVNIGRCCSGMHTPQAPFSINSPQHAQMCNMHARMTFARPSYNSQRFQDLQSLIASGCVTMPDNEVLQTISCSQERWNVIQETLHEAFSIFPYLTWQESQNLARHTGLTVKQVKGLFVVARLQHGISWEQDEIDNARLSLLTRSKNVSVACPMPKPDNPPANRSIFPGLPPITTKLVSHRAPQLTPEQCDILRWSFTTITLCENELNRLEEVTKLSKRAILQYFNQLQSEIGTLGPKSSLRFSHGRPINMNFPQPNSSGTQGQPPGTEKFTLDSLERLKRSTNHANKYFETSRFIQNRNKHFLQSNMLINEPKR